MKIRRFESAERWREIAQSGAALTLATGTPKTRGVARTTVFPTEEEAVARAEEKIRGYLQAGYVELDAATCEARRAWGEPMDLGTTTPEAEAAGEAKRAELSRARTARRATEAAAPPLVEDPVGEPPVELDPSPAPQAHAGDRWPAEPRWFERIVSGERWAILAHQGAVYESGLAHRVRVQPCASSEDAQALVAERIAVKKERGWVPSVPRSNPGSFTPRRPPSFLGASAAWARVQRAFLAGTSAMARAGTAWREEPRERHRAVLDRFRGPDEAPSLLSAAEEGLTLVMLERASRGADATGLTARPLDDGSALRHLVDFWVSRQDAAFALEALLASSGIGVHHERRGRGKTTVAFPILMTVDPLARASAFHVLRAHLSVASLVVRATATARMRAAFASGDPSLRCVLALAFPDERALVALAIDEHLARAADQTPDVQTTWLLASAGDAERARLLVERLPPQTLVTAAERFDDLVDVAGTEALDALTLALRRAGEAGAEARAGIVRRAAAYALGRIHDPRTTALLEGGLDQGVLDPDLFPGLVRSALLEPRRFVDRVAPAAAAGGTAGAMALALLTWMLRADPSVSPRSPGTGALRAMRVARARARRPEHEPSDSPAIPVALRASPLPRWREKAPTAPPPIALSALASEDREVWPPGLREAWSRAVDPVAALVDRTSIERDAHCEEAFDRARERGASCTIALLLEASPSIALAAWQEVEPARWRGATEVVLRAFMARHGLLALKGLVRFGEARPLDAAPLLLPFASPRLAGAVAACFAEPATRREAEAFLSAHPQAAARGLLPLALGPAGVPCTRAAQALFALGALGHGAVVREVAREVEMGGAITAIDLEARVEQLLGHDPRKAPPSAPHALPIFWDAPTLSAPVLATTGRALDPSSVEALGELLVIDATQERPELDEVKAACEPASLAALATEATLSWMASGAALGEAAVLGAVRHFGDDEAVRLIADLVRRADDDGDAPRARMLLDVLAGQGEALAVLHLVVLSRRARQWAVRAAASASLRRLARVKDVSVERLADASVPDFGLGEDGSFVLDFGGAPGRERRFRVGFDEHLSPFVLDPSGARKPHLPSIEPDDDPEKVLDAETSWRRIKHEVGALAVTTVERLEEAMIARRDIPLTDFDAYYRRHPLVRHVARRLIWEVEPGAAHFRIAEDGSLSDVTDTRVELGPAVGVRVAHPLHLDETELAAWRTVLLDYEIVQPFPQLDRPIHRVEATAGDGLALPGFSGRRLSPEAVTRLLREGFEHAPGTGFERRSPASPHALSIHLVGSGRPGLPATIDRVFFRGLDEATALPLRFVDPVERSEALLVLDRALGP